MKTPATSKQRLRPRVQLTCDDPSLAKQSFQDECNINNIIKRHHATGIPFPTAETIGAKFGDFAEVTDYHDSMLKVVKARESFAALPSAIRKQFANDPGEFIAFVHDPENHDQLIEMGLAHPAETTLVDDLAAAIKTTQKEPKTTTTTAPKTTWVQFLYYY